MELAGYLFAFGLTIFSGYLVFRQRLTAFFIIREMLIGVYLLIFLLMILDFLRVTIGSGILMLYYPTLSTTLSVAQAVLLLAAAVGMYMRPLDSNLRSFPSDLRKAPKHAFLFLSFFAVAVIADLYSAVISPPGIAKAVDIAGRQVPSMAISSNSASLVIVLLVFFLGYPITLLLLTVKRIHNPSFRRGVTVLPAGWAMVSIIYVFFESYLWFRAVDSTVLLYFLNSIIFFVVTREFRRSTILAGIVETRAVESLAAPRFSQRLGRSLGFLGGKKCLVQVNPALPYEATVREICNELLSLKNSVFVFTSKGSRVYESVSQLHEVKLFTMTSEASRIVPTDSPNEVLIPMYDLSLLLESFDKVVSAADTTNVSLIFDSISDLILYAGIESSYRFLKQVMEICSDSDVTCVALMFQNAHEIRIQNLIRSIFSTQVVEDVTGMKIVKFQESSDYLGSSTLPSKSDHKE